MLMLEAKLAASVLAPGRVPAFSFLCEFLALTGGFPDRYLAAPPFPGLAAGSRFAMTVVERGIISVSS